MLTTSEIAATATIWVLTAAGCFFGGRAALRKKKLKRTGTKSLDKQPTPVMSDSNSLNQNDPAG